MRRVEFFGQQAQVCERTEAREFSRDGLAFVEISLGGQTKLFEEAVVGTKGLQGCVDEVHAAAVWARAGENAARTGK